MYEWNGVYFHQGITRKATSGKIRIKPFYYGMKFDDETTYYFKLGSPIPGRVSEQTVAYALLLRSISCEHS